MGASVVDKGTGDAGGPQFPPTNSLTAGGASSSRFGDWVFKNTTMLFALALATLVVLIVFAMIANSRLSLAKFGWGFLTGTTWDPVHQIFGAAPFAYGTIVSSIVALIIGVPVSIGIAVFLVELSPRKLSEPVSFVVQLIAAIPSVVFGLWGIFVLAPLLREHLYPWLQTALG
ncbi:MAG TPA: phosphate ABC transporter permease subunit PstC, partial [Blastocatellia bacterium]